MKYLVFYQILFFEKRFPMNPRPLKYIEKENTDVNFYVYVDIGMRSCEKEWNDIENWYVQGWGMMIYKRTHTSRGG